MKKKLISLAVAGAMAAPAAAMAEAIIYGKLHVSLDYATVTNASQMPMWDGSGDGTRLVPTDLTAAQQQAMIDNGWSYNGKDFKGWGVNGEGGYMPGSGRANRVGIKGSEDLGNGLKAIYQVEFGVPLGASDNDPTSGDRGRMSMRNSFVGLAGSFGTVLIGRHDTPFKISTGKLDMFSDTMADYNGTIGFDDLRVDNTVAYISPKFSGFQFMGALVAPGGATDGNGLNVNSDQLNSAWSVAGIYSNGPFYGSIAYESLSNEMFMTEAQSIQNQSTNCFTAGVPNNACSYVSDDYNKWRLGAGILDWNGFTLTAVYEKQDNPGGGGAWGARVTNPVTGALATVPTNLDSQTLWQIQAGYSFGNNMIKAMYGQVSRDYDFSTANIPGVANTLTRNFVDAWDGDRSAWAVAFDHNFSKRTKAYVLYTDVDDDAADYGPIDLTIPNAGYTGVAPEGNTTWTSWSGFSVGMIHKF